MSTWLHLNGQICIDAIRFNKNIKIDPKELFGKPFGYDDYKIDENNIIPYGSEGSVQHNIYFIPDEHSIRHAICGFWADLRDVEDYAAIEEWLEKVIKNIKTYKGFPLMIRDFIFTVHIEGYQTTRLYYLNNEGQLKKVDM